MPTQTANSEAQLNAAIAALDGTTVAGTYTIALTGSIGLATALNALNLHAGVSVVIDGQGNLLDGLNTQRGLFVYVGVVTIQNLTIQNAAAAGGNGGSGGGGGAGLGGGLFVASSGTVALSNVTFTNDQARGGNGSVGSFGGGGGLGSNGGSGPIAVVLLAVALAVAAAVAAA